jgi:hypothetical protein
MLKVLTYNIHHARGMDGRVSRVLSATRSGAGASGLFPGRGGRNHGLVG